MIERLHFRFSLSCIGEGNGNPLQCSCLENPRDSGAWWAAVYGVHRVGHNWSDLAAAAAVTFEFALSVLFNKLGLSFLSLALRLGFWHTVVIPWHWRALVPGHLSPLPPAADTHSDTRIHGCSCPLYKMPCAAGSPHSQVLHLWRADCISAHFSPPRCIVICKDITLACLPQNPAQWYWFNCSYLNSFCYTQGGRSELMSVNFMARWGEAYRAISDLVHFIQNIFMQLWLPSFQVFVVAFAGEVTSCFSLSLLPPGDWLVWWRLSEWWILPFRWDLTPF